MLLLLAAPVVSIDATAADKAKPAADTLVVLPGEFTLSGPVSFQRLLPGLMHDGRFTGTPPGQLDWSSSNPKVVTITDGTARPAGNGQADLRRV